MNPMKTALKERIVSLAYEAQRIRGHVQRHRFIAQEHRIIQRLLDSGYSLVQIKRILGRARRPVGVSPDFHEHHQIMLHHHRTVTLRKEARNHLLAYAFLRGKPYGYVETAAYERPDWDEIERLVLKYGLEIEQVIRQRFAEWKHNGEMSYETNHSSLAPQVEVPATRVLN